MLISKYKKEEDVVNIHALQELIGLKLPSDYVGFLQKYNGGITPKTNWNGKGKIGALNIDFHRKSVDKGKNLGTFILTTNNNPVNNVAIV